MIHRLILPILLLLAGCGDDNQPNQTGQATMLAQQAALLDQTRRELAVAKEDSASAKAWTYGSFSLVVAALVIGVVLGVRACRQPPRSGGG